MRSAIFMDAVESSTRLFGRKDVNVVFQGDGAHTDGNTVVLPALPQTAEISVDQADVLRGYRDHEAMHIRCTDTSTATMNRLAATAADPLLHAMTQYSEDVRIEHAGISEYPGMAKTLSALNAAASKELMAQLAQYGELDTIVPSLPKDLVYRIAASAHGRQLIGVEDAGISQPLIDRIKAAHPDIFNLAQKHGKLMSELPTGYKAGKLVATTAKRGTEHAFNLAERMVKEFKELIQQQEQQQQQQPDQPQPQDDQQQGGQGNGDGGQGQGDQPDQCQGDQPSPDDGNGQGGNGQQGQGDNGQQQGDPSNGQGQQGNDKQQATNGQSSGQPGPNTGQGKEHGQGQEQGSQHGGKPQADDQQGGQDGGKGSGGGTFDNLTTTLDQGYKAALDKTVQDIAANGTTSGGGSRFRIWSSRFVARLSFYDAVYQTHANSHHYSARDAKHIADAIAEGALDRYRMLLDMISGKRAMIRRLLELELQARSDRRWESGKSSGRLQSIRLVSAMQGAENVYQRRESGKDMDTVLRISIDASGSMKGVRSREACALTVALIEALERTGCDIEAQAWTASNVGGAPGAPYSKKELIEAKAAWNESRHNRVLQDPNTPGIYTSLGSLTLVSLKTIQQRSSNPEMAKAIGSFCDFSLSGTTPTYHALMNDVVEMSRHKHAKKVLLFITDGEADRTLEPQAPNSLMREIEDAAERAGIYLIGVGIAGMDVSHDFKHAISVSGADAYEPVIKTLAKYIAKEIGHASFKRAA